MNKNNYLRNIIVLSLLPWLAACVSLRDTVDDDLAQAPPAVHGCMALLDNVDEVVAQAGVADAEAHRVAGYPYLRVDRFSASFRNTVSSGDAWTPWVARLRKLDQDARRAEISNLPAAVLATLDGGGRALLWHRIEQCAGLLMQHDQAAPARRAALSARARVPDAYATAQRIAGLYALTRVPFSWGIERLQNDILRDFREVAAGREPAQPLLRYALREQPAPALTREPIAALIRRASRNALRIPEFSDGEREWLARAHAPRFAIETGGAFDRFGRLAWRSGAAPVVDHAAPVVYYRVAYTRYHSHTLTQLVYTLWFPQRPREHALDLLAGALDGVVFRVTLSPEGEPLLYDSMHACGCFHWFFPTARVQPLPAPDGAGEWAFIPATLPPDADVPITVRIATRTHYLLKVAPDNAVPTDADVRGYTLQPEDSLRAVPHGTGTRSVYGPDGLIPGSERGERFFFWPMGIHSAGAMRQWGHHATAFIGRRHFDDAQLIEKRFRVLREIAP